MNFPENAGDLSIIGLGRKNILLGKNGAGKSWLLKQYEQHLRNRPEIGVVRYLVPERGGNLFYDPGVEHHMRDPNWLQGQRRQNQTQNFRQQSAAQYRRLETLILREIETNPVIRTNHTITFDKTIERLNVLLDRVYLARSDPSFQIHDRQTQNLVNPENLSSGESELISLGIECLAFEKECKKDKLNLLLIDEPDVHLHPDLQARFAAFLEGLLAEGNAETATDRGIGILIATHSTALLGAMSDDEHTRLAFMQLGDTNVVFRSASDALKRVLPVFGAHPLSNVFNQAPVLLIEGEDDERIWQQAVRSSKGAIKVYPCAVDGITEMSPCEQEACEILNSVYDNATGYSLRDRDMQPDEINDVGPVKRMRLHCRAAENLLLSDEVLRDLNLTWDQVRSRLDVWIAANSSHPHFAEMKSFAEGAYDRCNADLKAIRNDLVGIMGSNKPWEVLVGQAIARVLDAPSNSSPSSILAFLGNKVCYHILGKSGGLSLGKGDTRS